MIPHLRASRTGILVALLATCGLAQAAESIALAEHPITKAVVKGQCTRAGSLVNSQVEANDAQAAFIAGRMLDEGICVQADPALSYRFFERSEKLGSRTAAFEEAAQIGQGMGSGAGYERAGEVCRLSGADADHRLDNYSLGYVCTLAVLAGRSMRLTLSEGVFLHPSEPIVILVDPARSDPSIVSAPPVAKEREAATGSRLRRPVINLEEKLAEAWKSARASAPRPDTSALRSGASVSLPIDVNMVLELALAVARDPNDDPSGPTISQLPSLQYQHVGGAKGN